MTKWEKFKWHFANLRRHRYMVLVIIILSALCYIMFTKNYELQRPYRSKHSGIPQELWTDIWNERAACLSQVDAVRLVNNAEAESWDPEY